MKTAASNSVLLSFPLLSAAAIQAQTIKFTYQAILKEGTIPAKGNCEFEFRLFDSWAGEVAV